MLYPCGIAAREALKELLSAGSLRCEAIDHDRYRRTVVRCWVDGRDLGAEVVRLGWAVDFPRYSHGFYGAEEQEARGAKRGLWAGEFVSPSEWRRSHKGRHVRRP
jgi:endonuclease YncB( thermonuclease family)